MKTIWDTSGEWKHSVVGCPCILFVEKVQITVVTSLDFMLFDQYTESEFRVFTVVLMILTSVAKAVFTACRCLACVAWRFFREHYWAAKPQKRGQSKREREAKPRGPNLLAVSLPSPAFIYFAKPNQNRHATQANRCLRTSLVAQQREHTNFSSTLGFESVSMVCVSIIILK